MRNFIFWAISLVLVFCFSDSYGDDPVNPSDGRKITGQVKDADLDQPMEYVNVVLYRSADSSMVTGTITNASGNFVLNKVDNGDYYLVVNFIGYDKNTVDDIEISNSGKPVDVGVVNLKQAVTELKSVEVVGQRAPVQYKIDRKVVDLTQNFNAQGGTVAQALENVPSVNVDIEGNVSLRGSGNFTVLIDGKPSVLGGSDALQQLPANAVERVEIITNPSAKYDPDGTAGIINVIMKKNIRTGLNGIVNTSASTGDKYSTDMLLNYRDKKVSYMFGANYNNQNYKGTGDIYEEIYQGMDTIIRHTDGSRNFGRSGYGIKGGVDFNLTESFSLGLNGHVGQYEFNRSGASRITEDSLLHRFDTLGNPMDLYKHIEYISETESPRKGTYYSFNFTTQKKFDDKGHELQTSVYYSKRDAKDSDKTDSIPSSSPLWLVNKDEFYKSFRKNETDNSDELEIKIDYTRPFLNGSKLEAGFQSQLERDKEGYSLDTLDYNGIENEYKTDSSKNSAMTFINNVHSIYVTFGGKSSIVDYQLGLRGEIETRNLERTGQDTYTYEDPGFFPSVHLSRKFGENHQLMASYSKRIDRPRGRDLEPDTTYYDINTVRIGNPQLKSSLTNSYEFGYQYSFGQSFLSIEGFYRDTKNPKEFFPRYDSVMRKKILQSENFAREFSTGTEFMLNWQVIKPVRLNLSSSVYYYEIPEDKSVGQRAKSSINSNFRANATANVTKTTRIQINGFYNGGSVTARGENEGFMMWNAAVKQDFFKRSLTATFQVQDIFQGASHEFTTISDNLYSNVKFTREAPIFTLSLSYKINNYKPERDQSRMGGDDGGGMDVGY